MARAGGVSARGIARRRRSAARRSPRPSPRRSSWRAPAASNCARTAPFGPIYLRSPAARREAPSERAGEQQLRLLEALLFAAPEPLARGRAGAAARRRGRCRRRCCASWPRPMPGAASIWCGSPAAGRFAPRPISRRRCGSERAVARKLSRAAVETLAVDRLSPAGDPRRDRGDPRRRAGARHARPADGGRLGAARRAGARRRAGRSTGSTTPAFLAHFGLDSLNELPGIDELRAAGLLDLGPAVLGETARRQRDRGIGSREDGESTIERRAACAAVSRLPLPPPFLTSSRALAETARCRLHET